MCGVGFHNPSIWCLVLLHVVEYRRSTIYASSEQLCDTALSVAHWRDICDATVRCFTRIFVAISSMSCGYRYPLCVCDSTCIMMIL